MSRDSKCGSCEPESRAGAAPVQGTSQRRTVALVRSSQQVATLLWALWLLWVPAGCTSDPALSLRRCDDGATIECACTNGATGTQLCTEGAFLACVCDGAEPDAADSGGRDATDGSDSLDPDDAEDTQVEPSTFEFVIPAAGGVVQAGDVRFEFPVGAVTEDTAASLAVVRDAEVPGYEPYSAMYVLEPRSLVLERQAVVRLPHEGDAARASLFQRRGLNDLEGFEHRGGLASAEELEAHIPRWDDLFVADGVDFLDAPDRSCTSVRVHNLAFDTTASVGMAVSVEDCAGRPITDLSPDALEVIQDGEPLGDGVPMLGEVAPEPGWLITLVLDLSGTDRLARAELAAAMGGFLDALEAEGLAPRVGVETYDGWNRSTEVLSHTRDLDQVRAALDTLEGIEPLNAPLSNFYGAVVAATVRMAAAAAVSVHGAETGGAVRRLLIVYADEDDTTAFRSRSDVENQLNFYNTELFLIGKEGESFAPGSPILAIADHALLTHGLSTLPRELGAVARHVGRAAKSLAILRWCTAARAGSHAVGARLRGSRADVSHTASLELDGIVASCSLETLGAACGRSSCGGLICGFCDDGESCVPQEGGGTQCLGVCEQRGLCNGETITLDDGSELTCHASASFIECNSRCLRPRVDPDNCGDCGVRCAPDLEFCDSGRCAPLPEVATCGAELADLSLDPRHCGACDNACAVGEFCGSGVCQLPPPGFVLIEPGTFTMGSPDTELGRSADERQFEVTLTRPFLMGASETTWGEWRRVRDELFPEYCEQFWDDETCSADLSFDAYPANVPTCMWPPHLRTTDRPRKDFRPATS